LLTLHIVEFILVVVVAVVIVIFIQIKFKDVLPQICRSAFGSVAKEDLPAIWPVL
jgi:hypothetical protein